MLIAITSHVSVDPTEVSSIQEVTLHMPSTPSGTNSISFSGSVLTLKNGRKIYVSGMKPIQINELLTK